MECQNHGDHSLKILQITPEKAQGGQGNLAGKNREGQTVDRTNHGNPAGEEMHHEAFDLEDASAATSEASLGQTVDVPNNGELKFALRRR